MEVYGSGRTKYGPGVAIQLTGDEVAEAIDDYLATRGIQVNGPRTISVNGEACDEGHIYVDPSGVVIAGDALFSGRGPEETTF